MFLIFPRSGSIFEIPYRKQFQFPNVTVRICEDSSTWIFLRLYLLFLATNKSLVIGSLNLLAIYRLQCH